MTPSHARRRPAAAPPGHREAGAYGHCQAARHQAGSVYRVLDNQRLAPQLIGADREPTPNETHSGYATGAQLSWSRPDLNAAASVTNRPVGVTLRASQQSIEDEREDAMSPLDKVYDYSQYGGLKVEKQDRVMTITLDAPESMNAFSAEMHHSMSRIWDDVQDDPEVNVVVLTGAGRAFSAGGNVIAMQQKIDNPELWDATTLPEAKRIIFRMLECDKPVIARVNGHAVGLGATVALMCDIIIAADTAKIGDPHVNAGLVAGDGGALIWPQLIGFARAKEYLFTGDLMTAAEAHRIGLINHVVPPEELDERVYGLARRLAAGATRSIRWTKQVINIPLRQIAHATMDLSLSLETQSNLSRDHQEAVSAFAAKRRPNFTGG